jgi:hypothetical protein
VGVSIHIFLTSVLVGGEWQLNAPADLPPPPGIHWVGGGVDPRAGLDDVEKRKFLTLPELELRPLGRPARSYTDYAIPLIPPHMLAQQKMSLWLDMVPLIAILNQMNI